jgi:hypothetical protein
MRSDGRITSLSLTLNPSPPGRGKASRGRGPRYDVGMVCEGPRHFHSVLFSFIQFSGVESKSKITSKNGKIVHPPTLFVPVLYYFCVSFHIEWESCECDPVRRERLRLRSPRERGCPSPISRRIIKSFGCVRLRSGGADWKSAIQQVPNLRYECDKLCIFLFPFAFIRFYSLLRSLRHQWTRNRPAPPVFRSGNGLVLVWFCQRALLKTTFEKVSGFCTGFVRVFGHGV